MVYLMYDKLKFKFILISFYNSKSINSFIRARDLMIFFFILKYEIEVQLYFYYDAILFVLELEEYLNKDCWSMEI